MRIQSYLIILLDILPLYDHDNENFIGPKGKVYKIRMAINSNANMFSTNLHYVVESSFFTQTQKHTFTKVNDYVALLFQVFSRD